MNQTDIEFHTTRVLTRLMKAIETKNEQKTKKEREEADRDNGEMITSSFLILKGVLLDINRIADSLEAIEMNLRNHG